MSTVSSAAAAAPSPRGSLSLSRMSDELLARQAARGSERAFAALYQRYHQQLYRYCRSIVRHDADAQDVLQSSFTAALSALRRNGRNAPLRPWLYRIAHNEAITLLRRRRRESGQELSDSGPHAVSSAEDQAADRARWSTLVSDLATLPERQRGALVMRELSGLSHEEIAIALGTGVGGAKQAIFEARQALAELAEGRAMSCEEVRRRISAGDRRVLRGRRVRAHLGECHGCEAFAAEIPARRAELRAFTPVLPAAAAAGVLSRSLHAASAHGASGATVGSATATAGAVGKAAGTAVLWKAATGVAVLATAAAGVTGLAHVLRHHRAPARSAITIGGHRGAAAGSVRATGAAGVPGHLATSGATAGRTRTPVANAVAGGKRHSSAARAGASASSAHGLGKRAHGSGPGTAVERGVGASTRAARSHSAGRTRAPAGRGRAAGHHRAKSGTGAVGTTHPRTTGHPKGEPSPGSSAPAVPAVPTGTPGKLGAPQSRHAIP